ncbi:MAG: CocE/NonD family hydrolase [Candidatus Latescibacteria bacterium]|nr:CocE/NonD family hydrolase [Candidatus Latescibacterota bacterium]
MIGMESERQQKRFPTTLEENLPAPMRDKTLLRADVYRPEGDGPFPVLLCRTPYDKGKHRELGHRLAERGYLVVVQDCRGRYASDGAFRPGLFSAEHDDAEDGYDTVEWAAGLPASTGRVGTFGCSYDGWTQWELAHTRPPHLAAMMPAGIAANLLDRELSGVLRLGRVLAWTVNNLSVDTARRLNDPWKPRTAQEADRLYLERDRLKWLWFLPLMDIPDDAMPGMGPHWRRWLEDHAMDHFRFEEKHRQVNVPALSMTGWYDQQIGTIKQFTGMVKNGRTEDARRNQRLIVGPWTHTLVNLGSRLGAVDFGPEACRDFYDIADAWFAHWLKEEPTEAVDWPPIQLFVMGANQWRAEHEWPLARTVYTVFYLHSGGHASTAVGDGALSLKPPQEEPPDKYIYDPRDPVMTLSPPAASTSRSTSARWTDGGTSWSTSRPPWRSPWKSRAPSS